MPSLFLYSFGAPLIAREVEQGTHRLVWTQSTTRLRWLAAKLSVLIGLTFLVFVFLTVFFSWWSAPVDAALGPWKTYDVQGTLLVIAALFALMVGIAMGTLIRRSVAAMAFTIVVFLLLRLGTELLLRPFFLPPLQSTWDFTGPDPQTRDWILGRSWVDHQGKSIAPPVDCLNNLKVSDWYSCLHNHGVLALTSYQPADRFWVFQGIEAVIFLGLAGFLLVLTIWWVRRRIN